MGEKISKNAKIFVYSAKTPGIIIKGNTKVVLIDAIRKPIKIRKFLITFILMVKKKKKKKKLKRNLLNSGKKF